MTNVFSIIAATIVLGVSAAVSLAICGASLLLRAWVLSILWGWFVSPFFGVPALPMAYAIGLVLMAICLQPYNPNAAERTDRSGMAKAGYALFAALIGPLSLLLLGWVMKTWIV